MNRKWIAGIIAVMTAAGSLFAAEQDAKRNMEQTCKFIKEVGHYFIATVDGDQPHVRPFGTIHIINGKLYIQTGKAKNVSKQLGRNGKTELCTMNGKRWIRVTGTLVNDDNVAAKKAMLDAYPSLKGMYSPTDANTQVLYFKPGGTTAVIYSFTEAPITLKF